MNSIRRFFGICLILLGEMVGWIGELIVGLGGWIVGDEDD